MVSRGSNGFLGATYGPDTTATDLRLDWLNSRSTKPAAGMAQPRVPTRGCQLRN